MSPQNEITRTHLLTASLESGMTVERVEVKAIELAAHWKTGLHLHPCPVLGYVVEGTILFEVEGAPVHVLRKGEALFEPAPGADHDAPRGLEVPTV